MNGQKEKKKPRRGIKKQNKENGKKNFISNAKKSTKMMTFKDQQRTSVITVRNDLISYYSKLLRKRTLR